jgi:hypothetical protein
MDQDRPYIEPPPEKKTDDGCLFCFFDKDRMCAPDCMSFAVTPPAGVEYKEQWANCKILTGLHQVSKHLVILAQVSKAQMDSKIAKGAF